MRIVFFVGTRRGFLTLGAAVEAGMEVCGIVSLEQDAHEAERFELPIAELAAAHGIPLVQTKFLSDASRFSALMTEWQPELGFVVGARVLIPQSVIDAVPGGLLAAHDSLLPAYRGFAPLNWAIINGESETGVTLFLLSEAMDAGLVFGQAVLTIAPDETAPALYQRIGAATITLVIDAWRSALAGTLTGTPQNEAAASYTCPRIPADGLIDWTRPTAELVRLVRALTYPYAGAFTFYRGERLFVWSAEVVTPSPRYVARLPGRVVGLDKYSGSVDVLTGDGVIRLREVGTDSEHNLRPIDVIKSIRVSLGLDPMDLWLRIRELEKHGSQG
jgi:methionyl-tRNA formyltransferase